MRLLVVLEEAPGRNDSAFVEHLDGLAELGHEARLLTMGRGEPHRWSARCFDSAEPAPPREAARGAGFTTTAVRLGRQGAALARTTLVAPHRTRSLARRSFATSRRRGPGRLLRNAGLASIEVDAVVFGSAAAAVAHYRLPGLLGVKSATLLDDLDLDILEADVGARNRLLRRGLDVVDLLVLVTGSDTDRTRLEALRPDLAGRLRALTPAPLTLAAEACGALDSDAEPVVATVGPLDHRGGTEYLIVALTQLTRRGVGCRVEIVGSGPSEDYLRFTTGQLGIDERVTWLGPVTSAGLGELGRRADLVLSSGTQERVDPALLTIIEQGVPVVTTHPLGVSETDLVVEGRSGRIVPGRDAEALACAIAELLGDRDQLVPMGRAARDRCHQRYSRARHLVELASLLSELAEPGRSQR